MRGANSAQSIVDESTQMTQLIANVLDMTRLEVGPAVAKPEWVSLQEVVGRGIAAPAGVCSASARRRDATSTTHRR